MSKKTSNYYRLTQDADIEGTPREKGFTLILDEKKAEYYAGVLEPAEAPTEEGDPILEPEPHIVTLQELQQESKAIVDAPEGTYAEYQQDHPTTPTKTRKAKA